MILWYPKSKTILSLISRQQCKTHCPASGERPNTGRMPGEHFQGGDKDTRLNPCNQKLARHPPIISVWCLPCNTGNPNQNYQVHITKLHTNYRHQLHTTLPLVVGVIFAPQLSYFNSMSVCFTVWVIAGLGLFPCVLTLKHNHTQPQSRTRLIYKWFSVSSFFETDMPSFLKLLIHVSVFGCILN